MNQTYVRKYATIKGEPFHSIEGHLPLSCFELPLETERCSRRPLCRGRTGISRITELSIEQQFGCLRQAKSDAQLSVAEYLQCSALHCLRMMARRFREELRSRDRPSESVLTEATFLGSGFLLFW